VESTFLFTDLVGFTALTAERGDDHAADVALAFFDVVFASRLCSAAAGGEVLVSERTHAAAGRVRGVVFGERRVHWLRNVTEPVAVLPATSRRLNLPSLPAMRLRSIPCPPIRPEPQT